MFCFNLRIFPKSFISSYKYETLLSLLCRNCQHLWFPCRSQVSLQNICSEQNYSVTLVTFLTITKCCVFISIDGYIKLYQVWLTITGFIYMITYSTSNTDKVCQKFLFNVIIFLSFLILIYYNFHTYDQTSIPISV